MKTPDNRTLFTDGHASWCSIRFRSTLASMMAPFQTFSLPENPSNSLLGRVRLLPNLAPLSRQEPRPPEGFNWTWRCKDVWRGGMMATVALFAFGFASGCGERKSDSKPIIDSQSQGGVAIERSNIIVADRLQRTLCFAKVPQRIVSLSPSTTELMFAIGAGSQLVGATEHCNYPAEAAKLTRVGGGTLQGISRETILSLNPDLILCKWDSHQPLIEPFDRFKIPIMAIGPDTLAELVEEATLLGRVTGHVTEADELVSRMKQRVALLTSWVDSLPMEERLRVFYEVWDEPLMTAGPKCFIGEMLEMSGMKNIFSDTTVRYPRISDEVVLDRNPQVILAPSTHRSQVSLEILSKRQGWDKIAAVRDRKVFLIDGDRVSRCGPRMLDALEEMIRAVYPDRLPKDSANEPAEDTNP